ncbi:MAG: hypothetical protein ACFFCZ_16595 [Promethearchaeota archaeon]
MGIKTMQIAEELKGDFEAEGNLLLWEASITEAEDVIKQIKEQGRKRYLYHVIKSD